MIVQMTFRKRKTTSVNELNEWPQKIKQPAVRLLFPSWKLMKGMKAKFFRLIQLTRGSILYKYSKWFKLQLNFERKLINTSLQVFRQIKSKGNYSFKIQSHEPGERGTKYIHISFLCTKFMRSIYVFISKSTKLNNDIS